MKYVRTHLALLLFFVLLAGCAAGPAGLPQYNYQEKAIQINLKADAKLHWNEGTAHTLMLCVYQLRDINSFSQLSSTSEGLYSLLECRNSDPSMITASRVFIQPGESSLLTYDRAEGTRDVGVIAGYFDMRDENMVRAARIPVIKETTGFFKRTEIAYPGTLTMSLHLGSYGIISP